jgi:hypothetical protein
MITTHSRNSQMKTISGFSISAFDKLYHGGWAVISQLGGSGGAATRRASQREAHHLEIDTSKLRHCRTGDWLP